MATELSKVLLAEDDEDILEVARMSLEVIGGLQVETCRSGVDVLDKAISFKPDLIILDVMMPVMDGPAAFETLRESDECKDIPVIFMTAKVMSEEVADLKSLGALAVIAKPFDPVALPQQLKDILIERDS